MGGVPFERKGVKCPSSLPREPLPAFSRAINAILKQAEGACFAGFRGQMGCFNSKAAGEPASLSAGPDDRPQGRPQGPTIKHAWGKGAQLGMEALRAT